MSRIIGSRPAPERPAFFGAPIESPAEGSRRVDADSAARAVVIPFPGENSQRFLGVDADSTWRYEHHVRGGGCHRFIGEVTYVGGTEGDRLRKELAAVIADLLQWAKQDQSRSDTDDLQECDRAA